MLPNTLSADIKESAVFVCVIPPLIGACTGAVVVVLVDDEDNGGC